MAPTTSFTDADRASMRVALDQARDALDEWEVPCGCALERDGEIVADEPETVKREMLVYDDI